MLVYIRVRAWGIPFGECIFLFLFFQYVIRRHNIQECVGGLNYWIEKITTTTTVTIITTIQSIHTSMWRQTHMRKWAVELHIHVLIWIAYLENIFRLAHAARALTIIDRILYSSLVLSLYFYIFFSAAFWLESITIVDAVRTISVESED